MGGSKRRIFAGYGKNDFFVILDMPNSVRAAAASLVVKTSGAVSWSTDFSHPKSSKLRGRRSSIAHLGLDHKGAIPTLRTKETQSHRFA
jgi:hypothetical protein